MKEAEYLSKQIKRITGINMFEKNRRREVIEARALFNFMLYQNFSYSLTRIAAFYHSKGMKKSYDHAVIYYSLKNFPMYLRFSHHLAGWMHQLEKANGQDFTGEYYLQNLNDYNMSDIYRLAKIKYEKQEAERMEQVRGELV